MTLDIVREMDNQILEPSASIVGELSFLRQRTGQDEATLLARALRLGLTLLHRQIVEQGFIDGSVTRDEAITVLGRERVQEIEYAKRALAQDVTRGLDW
jgi:phage FluMu protein gp41